MKNLEIRIEPAPGSAPQALPDPCGWTRMIGVAAAVKTAAMRA